MSNQEKLKNYLLGNENKDGYLKDEISNAKVIMLSGKWGSGKTHFWQNIIASDEFKKELKEKSQVYSYISLYGKSSIEEIENDIFSQAYYSAIGGENFVTKGFSTFTKRMSRFGSKKVASGLKEEQKDNIEKTALKRLENGGVICFDDFERKSKDIDLNDLFGFITQLTLNFKCKVVIILNDDVFEGEEKDIFSNVKEKTVSKYLKYKPSIEELFNSIFDNKYEVLKDYSDVILKTFEESEVLNARIYIQALDNLLEWIENDKTQKKNDDVVRCLILVNLYFILYHVLFFKEEDKYRIIGFFDKLEKISDDYNRIKSSNIQIYGSNKNREYKEYESLKIYMKELEKTVSTQGQYEIYKDFFDSNIKNYEVKFYANSLKIGKNVDSDIFSQINTFIETGILED
ncbi:KAP family NTPase [Arcobacter roscoffensis]|uniref:KAP family NTPase n=1 Tax=Arcobacter roscoffensis TaxID=2961520 RepID=A0ABY5E2A0_9BACT|nr:KAP family NTPase [Arcobacter roscoffensis]UTJ06317.1 KAP family NTPase [Arcobacter roscoffensis]